VHFANFDALKAAPARSLTNKIAFISYQMTKAIDGSGYGHAVSARVAGAVEAAKKGAVAFVMRSVGTDNARIGHTGVMRYSEDVKKNTCRSTFKP
jgi:hypothetical protein